MRIARNLRITEDNDFNVEKSEGLVKYHKRQYCKDPIGYDWNRINHFTRCSHRIDEHHVGIRYGAHP